MHPTPVALPAGAPAPPAIGHQPADGGAARELDTPPPHRLPWQAQAYLCAIVALAGAVVGAALVPGVLGILGGAAAGEFAPGRSRAPLAYLVMGLVAVAVATQHFPVFPGPGRKSDLSQAVYMTVVLVLEPALAVPVVAISQLLGQGTLALRHHPATGRRLHSLRGVAFNTAQWVLATTLGGLVYVSLRPDVTAAEGDWLGIPNVPVGPGGIAAAAAAGVVIYLVNTIAVAFMVALQRGGRPFDTWLAGRRRYLPEAAGMAILGLVAAWSLAQAPLLLVIVVIGATTLRRSLYQQAELARRDAELARRDAELLAQGELARLKDEFLGTVSHELRTPLTIVCGFSELLRAQRSALSPSAQHMVDRVAESAGHLTHMVDDLLDLSHIERGTIAVSVEDVDLVPLLRDILSGFRQRPGGDRLVAELPASLRAHADVMRVTQAVTNFLDNALKYAPEGEITLRGRSIPAASGTPNTVRVEVEDHGHSIPLAEQERIWEKFYRGIDVSEAGTTRGTGIGLAVVKHLIEAQGGRVGLYAVPQAGNCFWFELPGADPDADR
ncbi:MAG: HAMP domain-containing histidine kinase [Chloroflexota bacterium]|nr:HAMP domain-containing histidine kinase [Chloroflexota bacterium]